MEINSANKRDRRSHFAAYVDLKNWKSGWKWAFILDFSLTYVVEWSFVETFFLSLGEAKAKRKGGVFVGNKS